MLDPLQWGTREARYFALIPDDAIFDRRDVASLRTSALADQIIPPSVVSPITGQGTRLTFQTLPSEFQLRGSKGGLGLLSGGRYNRHHDEEDGG